MSLEYIIFDLDDTLYPRGSGMMQEVGRRIQQWLEEHLKLAPEEAAVVRRRYYERYGTTLGGLVAEHKVDYDDFLHFVHDFAVESYVTVDPELEAMLADLALRRVVYTNATVEYGWRVLRALGIADYFERIIGVETVGLRNKPYRDAYEQALAMLNTEGPQCIMVEDSARNLEPAKALGMKTILLSKNGAGEAAQAYRDSVDFVVEDVLEVREVVQRLLEG